jgi:hypothetical protein
LDTLPSVLDSAGLSVHPSPDSPLLFGFKSQRRFAGIGVKMTTDKQPASKPPIEQVGPYRNNTAPAAAKAGVGAKSLAEIQEALDARRRHNEALSKRDIGPRSSGNRDSK